MSARPRPVLRKRVDEWEEFRPIEVSRRHSQHSAAPKLLIATFIFALLVFIWLFFKPSIRGTVAQIQRAMAALESRNAGSRKPASSTTTVERRSLRSAQRREEALPSAARVPGPFEVYLLDGDRFIRVDSSNRSVLVNLQTGETTWMDSGAVPGARR